MRKVYFYTLGVIATAISFVYDKQILLAITSYRTPALDIIFNFLTTAGSLLPIPLFIVSLAMFYNKTNRKITKLWFTALTAFILTYVIKYAINRGRPDFADTQLPDSPSFPSAHSSTTFSGIPILTGKLKIAWIIFAVLVAYSRLYLGVHYLSDVIAGALFGYAIGDVFNKYDFFKRFKILKKLKIE